MKTIKELQDRLSRIEASIDRLDRALVTGHKITTGINVSPYIFGTEFRVGDLDLEVYKEIYSLLRKERVKLMDEREKIKEFLETLDSLVSGFGNKN